jgi:hypothetical protein
MEQGCLSQELALFPSGSAAQAYCRSGWETIFSIMAGPSAGQNKSGQSAVCRQNGQDPFTTNKIL